jgi:putative ABC transport system permease protein
VAGLAIAVTTVVALVGVADSFESSFLALYARRGADLVVQRRGGTVQLSKGIPLSFADRIRSLKGAGRVIGGLMDMITFEDRGLFMVLVNGWEPDCPVLDWVHITSGRRLVAGDLRSVMLGSVLAASLGKHSGDVVTIYEQPFRVVGVFESFSVYENGAVFMLLDELQRQMDRPGQVTGYIVQANPPGDSKAIADLQRQIEALDADVAATPCAEFVGSLSQIRIAHTMSWITTAIAILIGSFGVLNTMAMSVFERRAEIGTLRAIGWRKSRIVRLILTESSMLALGGGLIGIVFGLLATSLLAHWHVTSGLVQGDVSFKAICEGLLTALVMAAMGGAYPAMRIAAVPPLEALRDA